VTLLHATEVGRRVALSGLLPETAHFLLAYLATNSDALGQLLPDEAGHDGDPSGLNYCLLCAALMSPEFSGVARTRFVHFGFDVTASNPSASQWAPLLAGQPWQAYRAAVNAAGLMIEWIDGASFAALEGRFQAVRAGTVEGLCRDVVWCLSGLADIVAAATRADTESAERPTCLRTTTAQSLHDIRRLLSSVRLLTWRLNVGVPDPVLWLMEAQGSNGRPLVSRREALALHIGGFGTHISIRMRENWSKLIGLLRASGVPNPQERAKLIQDLADNWHVGLREKMHIRQVRRVGSNSAALFKNYYDGRGTAFETAFEGLLGLAGIRYTHFDIAPKKGAFDYLLHIDGRPDLPLECKSKQGNGLVPLNEVTDVLRSTELHGYAGTNCVTLCQPSVDPNVVTTLRGCGRLCVVEAHDLAEALVQVASKRALPQDLFDWLSQPGQATLETFLATSQETDS
jgi:helicase